MYFVGESFEIRVTVDGTLTGLDTYIIFEKPSGTTFQYPPDSVEGNELVYLTWPEDFNMAGFWKIQGFATDNDVTNLYGPIKMIEIKSHL